MVANAFTHWATSPAHVLLIREMSLHQGVRIILMLNDNSPSHQLELIGRATDGPCMQLGNSREWKAPDWHLRVGKVDGYKNDFRKNRSQ